MTTENNEQTPVTGEANNGTPAATDEGAETTDESKEPAMGDDGDKGGSKEEVTGREKFLRDKLRETEKELGKLRTADEERARAEMSEADRLKAERDDARTELAEARRAAIVEKHKLPAELADRLRGDTPEELEADAKALAELLPKESVKTPASAAGIGVGGGSVGDEFPTDPIELSRLWTNQS